MCGPSHTALDAPVSYFLAVTPIRPSRAISLKLGTKTTHYNIMHFNLICGKIQYGHQMAIMLRLFHVQSHYADMPEEISFKVDIRTKLNYIHMHVNLCRDMIQYGHRTAIFKQFLHVQNHYLDMTRPISIKLRTTTTHNVIHMQVNLFCNTFQYGHYIRRPF